MGGFLIIMITVAVMALWTAFYFKYKQDRGSKSAK